MLIPRTLKRATGAGVVTLGLVGASTLFSATAGAALPGPVDFAYTGAAQDYVVPEGVCAVEIVAAGAQGAAWEDDEATVFGGLGGVATSTVVVTPGETLQVNVGGAGTVGDAPENPGAGGWNGGGDGGVNFDTGGDWDPAGGGGGGGASDVRQGGTSLTDRIVVGGGGGGVGVDSGPGYFAEGFGVPGVGGNPATAGTGEPPSSGTYTPAGGGGAGTATAGGAGGSGAIDDGGQSTEVAPDGEPGALGVGGAGAVSGETLGGGGGGGGLFGGGGGGIGLEELDGAGGGGSSLGDSTLAGSNSGDGTVSITPTGECETPDTTTATTAPATTAPATTAPPAVAPPADAVAAQPDYTG